MSAPLAVDKERMASDVSSLWRVAAPFFTADKANWISDAVDRDDFRFELVRRPGGEQNWHERNRATSSLADWRDYRRHANDTLAEPSAGLIAVFPQLTAAMAARMRFRRDDRPLVSWFFNTTLRGGLRTTSARASLGRVDRFVVHSRIEIEAYAEILRLPQERFRYVPMQYGGAISEASRPDGEPYLFATGSGFRDYGTMFAAVEKLGRRTLVLAGPRALEGLDVPKNVEIIDKMAKDEIHRHVLHADANVIPMNTDGLTAGLVTIVECFCHGRAMVGTDRPGVDDYLLDDRNSLLAQPGDVDGLAERIEAMCTDDALRTRLDTEAGRFAEEHCTDAAAAASLVDVLSLAAGSQKAPSAESCAAGSQQAPSAESCAAGSQQAASAESEQAA